MKINYQEEFKKLGYILSCRKIHGFNGLKYYYIEDDKGNTEEQERYLGSINSKYSSDLDITLQILKEIGGINE